MNKIHTHDRVRVQVNPKCYLSRKLKNRRANEEGDVSGPAPTITKGWYVQFADGTTSAYLNEELVPVGK